MWCVFYFLLNYIVVFVFCKVLNVVLSVICKDDKISLICNNKKKGRNFFYFIMC